MNKLAEDLIIEVLLRLPSKSLLRLKCTCKAWCNLIKNPDFIAKHFNHPISEDDHHVLIKRCLQDGVTNVLSVHSNEELHWNVIVSPYIQIPYFDHYHVQIMGPCNGVVCITNYDVIVLCNPAIREFMLLPERPFGCPPDMYCDCEGVGFGYDMSTNDFKVIRIVDLIDEDYYTDHLLKAELYRHSINSWVEIDQTPLTVWYAVCFEICFQGCTHWFAQNDLVEKILSFNITTEVFDDFDYPNDLVFGQGNRQSLMVIHEFLALFNYTDPSGRTYEQFIEIWIMKEYGHSHSWTKQYRIEPLSEIEYPITFWKNSAFFLGTTNGKLIACTLDTHELKEFNIVTYPSSLRALIYKESLVSVRKVITEEHETRKDR